METHRNHEAKTEVMNLLLEGGVRDAGLAVQALSDAGFVFRIDTGHGQLAEMGLLVHNAGWVHGGVDRPYRRLVVQQRWTEDSPQGEVIPQERQLS